MQPLSALPTLTDDSTTINGDIDGDGKPDVEIDGTSAGSTPGLLITGSNNTIGGLVINRFLEGGVRINGGAQNLLINNYLGTDISGTDSLGGGRSGVFISDAPDNIIKDNLISGNPLSGVYIRSPGARHNIIIGNKIGTDIQELSLWEMVKRE